MTGAWLTRLADVGVFFGLSAKSVGDLVVDRLLAVETGDGAEHLFGAGDGRLDLIAGHDAQVVDREDVAGVDHGHEQDLVVEELDRDGAVAASQPLGDRVGDNGVDRGGGEVDVGHAQAAAQGLDQVELVDEPQVEKRLAEPLAGLLLAGRCLLDLLVADDLHLAQDVAKTHLGAPPGPEGVLDVELLALAIRQVLLGDVLAVRQTDDHRVLGKLQLDPF